MQLILMRHGEAIPFAETDAARVLTPRGISEATQVGRRLKASGFVIRAVHSSGYRRASQTRERVMAEAGGVLGSDIPNLTPDSPVPEALRALEAGVGDGDLVVFHQPLLTKLVGYLVHGDLNFDVEPRALTGTAYVLQLDTFLPGEARCLAVYQPGPEVNPREG